MNKQSMQQNFPNPEELLQQAITTPPWIPFDIQTSIPETTMIPMNKGNTTVPRSKRTRNSTSASINQKRSYYEAASTQEYPPNHHSDHHSVTTPATASSITNNSTNMSSVIHMSDHTNDNINEIIELLKIDMKNLQQTITSMETKIDKSTTETLEAQQRSEEKCQIQIDKIQQDTTQSIQNISNTFIEQMKLNQQSTNEFLVTIFEKREESLITKMNTQIQIALNQEVDSNRSPSRKRYHNQENYITLCESHNDDMETNPTELTNNTQKIYNPYQKDSIVHRNAKNVLPVTIN
jgi:hypothetical protein